MPHMVLHPRQVLGSWHRPPLPLQTLMLRRLKVALRHSSVQPGLGFGKLQVSCMEQGARAWRAGWAGTGKASTSRDWGAGAGL